MFLSRVHSGQHKVPRQRLITLGTTHPKGAPSGSDESDHHSFVWENSKIIVITRWELNIFLLILLITAIAEIITLMNAKAQPRKTQKQESKAHWRFLVNWQINSCSLFTASTLLCCIVCAGVCVPVIMQNGSVSSYSADSGAMRSKRSCEVVKGSRALQEEVLSLFF